MSGESPCFHNTGTIQNQTFILVYFQEVLSACIIISITLEKRNNSEAVMNFFLYH